MKPIKNVELDLEKTFNQTVESHKLFMSTENLYGYKSTQSNFNPIKKFELSSPSPVVTLLNKGSLLFRAGLI